MCGIVGVIDLQGRPVDSSWIDSMNDSIVHRGPDDSGSYVRGSVGLGMRRLSIIDVAGGHQPVFNEDRSVWIIYNGAIYNFPKLRPELEASGHHFSTNSETDVFVHIHEEMVSECVQYVRGTLAIAFA